MTRGLVAAVCSLGMLLGCGSDSKPGGEAGASGTGGSSSVDAASGGSVGSGGGGSSGSPGTGGSAGAAGAGTGGAVAGSGGAGVDAGPGDAGTGAMSSMMITAAAGGTLSAGAASLLVPAGALSADQMLTVSASAPAADAPNRDSIAGDVYDFGPSGTTFKVPVALSLTLPGAVPAGKRAVVAWLDPAAGQWFPVPSSVEGTKVTGRVSHFTSFALLLLDAAAICPFAGACGGSLEGTWKYSSSCLKLMESEVVKCGPSAVTLQQEYQVGGTINIAGGRYTAEHAITVSATMLYTPACIAAIREGGVVYADCAQIQEAWRKQNPAAQWVCSGTTDQGCSCLLTQSVMKKTMGAVVVTGQQVAFTEDGKPAGKPGDFCVKGNTLTARDATDGSVTTAVRQ